MIGVHEKQIVVKSHFGVSFPSVVHASSVTTVFFQP